MRRMIFPNLPVKDVEASRAFYATLGFGFDEAFCDDRTACVVVEENIMVMLLQEERFRDFIRGDIAPREATEMLLCLSCESRDEVERLVSAALAAGGEAWKEPMDEGVMYGHSFRDPDGHVWELMWMDVEAASCPEGAEGAGTAASGSAAAG